MDRVTKFLHRCFANNGVARGLLYVGISIMTTLAAAFGVWQTSPPENGYAIWFVIFKALADAGLVLRAFIDQHISRVNKSDEKNGTKTAREN